MVSSCSRVNHCLLATHSEHFHLMSRELWSAYQELSSIGKMYPRSNILVACVSWRLNVVAQNIYILGFMTSHKCVLSPKEAQGNLNSWKIVGGKTSDRALHGWTWFCFYLYEHSVEFIQMQVCTSRYSFSVVGTCFTFFYLEAEERVNT